METNASVTQVRKYYNATILYKLIKKLDSAIFPEGNRGSVFTTERVLLIDGNPFTAQYVLNEASHDEWKHKVLRDNYIVSMPSFEHLILREDPNFVRLTHVAKNACFMVRERYLHHHARGTADLRTNAWALTSKRFTVEQRGLILRIFRERGFGDYFINMKTPNTIDDDNAEELERVMRIRIDAEITSIAAAQTQTLTSLLGNLKFLTGTSGA